MTVTINQAVDNFSCAINGDKTITLKAYLGKNIVLYFYPKDNTPGCTQEGIDFQARLTEFEKLQTVILGVSRDSVKVHEGFREKQGYTFDLIADTEETLCQQFGVIQLKKAFGKESMGIVRSTFLIDKKGILQQIWSPVKVKGHAEEVLTAVAALSVR